MNAVPFDANLEITKPEEREGLKEVKEGETDKGKIQEEGEPKTGNYVPLSSELGSTETPSQSDVAPVKVGTPSSVATLSRTEEKSVDKAPKKGIHLTHKAVITANKK